MGIINTLQDRRIFVELTPAIVRRENGGYEITIGLPHKRCKRGVHCRRRAGRGRNLAEAIDLAIRATPLVLILPWGCDELAAFMDWQGAMNNRIVAQAEARRAEYVHRAMRTEDRARRGERWDYLLRAIISRKSIQQTFPYASAGMLDALDALRLEIIDAHQVEIEFVWIA